MKGIHLCCLDLKKNKNYLLVIFAKLSYKSGLPSPCSPKRLFKFITLLPGFGACIPSLVLMGVASKFHIGKTEDQCYMFKFL